MHECMDKKVYTFGGIRVSRKLYEVLEKEQKLHDQTKDERDNYRKELFKVRVENAKLETRLHAIGSAYARKEAEVDYLKFLLRTQKVNLKWLYVSQALIVTLILSLFILQTVVTL